MKEIFFLWLQRQLYKKHPKDHILHKTVQVFNVTKKTDLQVTRKSNPAVLKRKKTNKQKKISSFSLHTSALDMTKKNMQI